MLTRFALDQVRALRDAAASAREVPATGPDGWSVSPVDPARLLAVFTALRLRPGYRLCAYQYRSLHNGNGVVWAIPATAPVPAPSDCVPLAGRFLKPPRPPMALDDTLQAIDGDGTPLAYLSAALFAREAAEFGAIWHGCSWSDETLLDGDPWTGSVPAGDTALVRDLGNRIAALSVAEMVQLRAYLERTHGLQVGGSSRFGTWQHPRPEVWEPSVEMTADRVVVTFHTFTRYVRERVTRHRDTFQTGRYTFRTEATALAYGAPGYIS